MLFSQHLTNKSVSSLETQAEKVDLLVKNIRLASILEKCIGTLTAAAVAFYLFL